MKKYFRFHRNQFEYYLNAISITYGLNRFVDVTDELNEEDYIGERVYKIPTKNKSVDFIIYSAVDVKTDRMREKDNDAVRIVMRWKTKNGYMYKSISKHLRIKTLFVNIRKSILNASCEIFDLKPWEFSPDL